MEYSRSIIWSLEVFQYGSVPSPGAAASPSHWGNLSIVIIVIKFSLNIHPTHCHHIHPIPHPISFTGHSPCIAMKYYLINLMHIIIIVKYLFYHCHGFVRVVV